MSAQYANPDGSRVSLGGLVIRICSQATGPNAAVMTRITDQTMSILLIGTHPLVFGMASALKDVSLLSLRPFLLKGETLMILEATFYRTAFSMDSTNAPVSRTRSAILLSPVMASLISLMISAVAEFRLMRTRLAPVLS